MAHRHSVQATIEERGNGLPMAGDYVPGDDGELYLVELVGPIQTGEHGRGNWLRATLSPARWDDCPEDSEFPALAIL